MSERQGFILHAKTRPEKAEAFEALFRAYVEPSRAEPGCIEYHMLRDKEDPTLFIFYEIWASPGASGRAFESAAHEARFSSSAWSIWSAISISARSTCSAKSSASR